MMCLEIIEHTCFPSRVQKSRLLLNYCRQQSWMITAYKHVIKLICLLRTHTLSIVHHTKFRLKSEEKEKF